MSPAVPILGTLLILAAGLFVYFKHTMEGPDAPIVVVDRRTMRRALKQIAAAAKANQTNRAYAGIVSLIKWLEGEIHTGPRRYRTEYTELLEQARTARETGVRVIVIKAAAKSA